MAPPKADTAAARGLFEGASGAWIWDLAGGRIHGDARFAGLLGFDATAVAKGLPTEELFARVHPDDRLRLRIAVAGVAHGAEVFAREFRVPVGEDVRWLSARGRSEQDPTGRPAEFAGVLIDVTEQKRVEERLRIAQIAGGVGTFEYVEGFGTANVSDKFCQLLGLHVAKALPVRTINRVVHPDDPPLIAAPVEGEPLALVRAEMRIHRADTGEERWLALRGERRRHLEDAGISFIGVIYDISASKAAETKLRDLANTLEERVEARTQERDRLWNNSRDLFAVLSQDGVYRAVNPAWKTVLGYDESDLVGHSYGEFLGGEGLAEAHSQWSRRDGGLQDIDARMRAKDGGWRWINWTVIPLENDYYAIGRDVTERKQLEDELRQSQKMEAVGQLTGGIAHDFNNMLTGVLGGLDMVRRQLRDGRIEDARRFIDAAVTSAERAAALTHRLLAFSRRQSLDPVSTDPNELICSMEDLLRRTLGERVDLSVSLDPDVWTTLIDPNQLESAILNLAINARDAMPDGGKLTIETRNTRLNAGRSESVEGMASGEYVEVAVSDTGIGIPRHVVSRVFDPFFTTKPLGQGTGLGLSMVYGFARQSGGDVRIYSEANLGTTVKLYLPRHEGQAASVPEPAKREAPSGEGETVLVVEDDDAVRMIIVEVLNELGYKALDVSGTDLALEILASPRKIDLLVSDVGLPGLNGRQLAEIARQQRPMLPVLFITGYAASAARRSEFLGPGMEMISKPFAIDVLAARIREIIKG